MKEGAVTDTTDPLDKLKDATIKLDKDLRHAFAAIEKVERDSDAPICAKCRMILRTAKYCVQAIHSLGVAENEQNFSLLAQAARQILENIDNPDFVMRKLEQP